jgi:hypothetical protein
LMRDQRLCFLTNLAIVLFALCPFAFAWFWMLKFSLFTFRYTDQQYKHFHQN